MATVIDNDQQVSRDASTLHPDLQIAIRMNRITEAEARHIQWYVSKEFPDADEQTVRAVIRQKIFDAENDYDWSIDKGQPRSAVDQKNKKGPANPNRKGKTEGEKEGQTQALRSQAGQAAKQFAKKEVEDLAKKTAERAGLAIARSAAASGLSALGTFLLAILPEILIFFGIILIIIIALIGMCKLPGARSGVLSHIPGFSITKLCQDLNIGEINAGSNFGGGGGFAGGGVGGTWGDGTDAAARNALSAAGISVYSSGNCSDRNNRTCTSLEGMKQATVQEIINFKTACDAWAAPNKCTIIVTGGTEIGHATGVYSHYNGYKFDMALNTLVNSFITVPNFRSIGTRGGDGSSLFSKNPPLSGIYARESDHWDVVVNGSASAAGD